VPLPYYCTDGSLPQAGLAQGTDGNFYGTTTRGDTFGTAFKIEPGGEFTKICNFCSVDYPACDDGAYFLQTRCRTRPELRYGLCVVMEAITGMLRDPTSFFDASLGWVTACG